MTELLPLCPSLSLIQTTTMKSRMTLKPAAPCCRHMPRPGPMPLHVLAPAALPLRLWVSCCCGATLQPGCPLLWCLPCWSLWLVTLRASRLSWCKEPTRCCWQWARCEGSLAACHHPDTAQHAHVVTCPCQRALDWTRCFPSDPAPE